MYLPMAKRVILETDKRLLLKFAYNFGWRGMRSVQRFKKSLKKGEYFPPFLYVSVLNSCNLRCQGCWVDVAAKQEKIEPEQLHRLIREASEAGNSFFGILGGEPFMYKGLLDILAEHQDCYFQIFTNGQFITDEVAKKMRAMGNVTPLISLEGTELVSDEARLLDAVGVDLPRIGRGLLDFRDLGQEDSVQGDTGPGPRREGFRGKNKRFAAR